MTLERQRFQLLMERFEELCALPRDEQRVALGAIPDAAFRAELAALLEADRSAAPGLRTIVDLAEALDVPEPAPAVPSRIGGYAVLGVIGYGASGIVLRAREPETERIVAVKVLGSGAWNPAALERFRREIRILARLEHPAIARIYGAGTDASTLPVRPYFAMEFIDGVPITSWAREGRDGRRRPVEEIVRAIGRVVAAAGHAHASGVVHRDLKPGNVLVDAHGEVKVLDFGVAGMVDAAPASANDETRSVGATRSMAVGARSDHLVGTIPYMSPEQFEGSRMADARSDLYAIGVMLFECLVGRLPIPLADASLAEAALRVRSEEPPALGSVDRALRGDLEAVAARLLAKDPSRRYQSASEVAAELERLLAGEPTRARPPTRKARLGAALGSRRVGTALRARRIDVVAAVMAVVVVVVVAIVIVLAVALVRTRARLAKAESRIEELKQELGQEFEQELERELDSKRERQPDAPPPVSAPDGREPASRP